MRQPEASPAVSREQVLWTLLLVLTPLLLAAGSMLLFTARHERGEIERASLEVSRALAIAVDAELDAALSALDMLATDDSLLGRDLKAFHARARRALETRPAWRALIVSDLSGRHLLNSALPFGAELPPLVDRASFDAFVRDSRPRVGNIAAGQSGMFRFPARVPVLREGKPDLVLTAVIDPAPVRALIERQRVPAESLVAVLDAQDRHVARSRAHAAYLGREASPALRGLIRRGAEGTGATVTLERDEVFAAFSRVPASGWTVAVGVPRTPVERLRTWGYALLAPGFLLLALLAALSVRSLIRDARALEEARRRARGPR